MEEVSYKPIELIFTTMVVKEVLYRVFDHSVDC